MNLITVKAAHAPAPMTAPATTLLRGQDPAAVFLPGDLATRSARRVGLERGSHLRLHRQMERWQATGGSGSRSLVTQFTGAPRCKPTRQVGPVVRLRRTGQGPRCRRPDLKRRKRFTRSKACAWVPAR